MNIRSISRRIAGAAIAVHNLTHGSWLLMMTGTSFLSLFIVNPAHDPLAIPYTQHFCCGLVEQRMFPTLFCALMVFGTFGSLAALLPIFGYARSHEDSSPA